MVTAVALTASSARSMRSQLRLALVFVLLAGAAGRPRPDWGRSHSSPHQTRKTTGGLSGKFAWTMWSRPMSQEEKHSVTTRGPRRRSRTGYSHVG